MGLVVACGAFGRRLNPSLTCFVPKGAPTTALTVGRDSEFDNLAGDSELAEFDSKSAL